jgi:hypothetical protein
LLRATNANLLQQSNKNGHTPYVLTILVCFFSDLASLRQGIHSTSSLPLEDINEEDSEYSSEPGEEMMNVGPTPHSSAASSEDNE